MDEDRWIDDDAANADGDDADAAAADDAAGAARFRRDVADVVFLVGKTETDSWAAEEEDDNAAAFGVLDEKDDNCLAASNLTRNCRSITLVQSKTKSNFNRNVQSNRVLVLRKPNGFLPDIHATNFHLKQLYHM